MSALLEEEQSQLMILFQEQKQRLSGLDPQGADCPGFSCCPLEQSELHLVGSGPLRGMVRELQGAPTLTYSAMVATQKPLVTGHGGSQLSLAKELAPFYWRTTLHSSNYSFSNSSIVFNFV